MELVYKRRGQTPLDSLNELRLSNPNYKDVPLSYAGRLDPMAEGLLLVLVGDENKEREKYLNLDKEYEVDILFGVETDTYDVLGKVITASEYPLTPFLDKKGETLRDIFSKYVGKFEQEYPPYSSKPVNGKPLFEWARENKLYEIEIPKKHVEIYSLQVLSQTTRSVQELYWGSFSRTVLLPEEIDVETSEAIERHGLLTIKLPKVDKRRQTKLRVKTNA